MVGFEQELRQAGSTHSLPPLRMENTNEPPTKKRRLSQGGLGAFGFTLNGAPATALVQSPGSFVCSLCDRNCGNAGALTQHSVWCKLSAEKALVRSAENAEVRSLFDTEYFRSHARASAPAPAPAPAPPSNAAGSDANDHMVIDGEGVADAQTPPKWKKKRFRYTLKFKVLSFFFSHSVFEFEGS